MTAREKYDLMIREEVGPWLRERGFKKRRNRFTRSDASGWQVVDFQASQFGSSDDVGFTINLWTGVQELAEVDPGALVDTRIGELMPGGEDHWWSVDTGTDPGRLGEELRLLLAERALPWLEERSSLERLVALARSSPSDFPGYAIGRFGMLLTQAGHAELGTEVSKIGEEH